MKIVRQFVLFAAVALLSTYGAAYGQVPAADDGQKIIVTSVAHIGTQLFAGTRKNGVYSSVDSGKTWAPVNNGLPVGGYITELAANGNAAFAIVLHRRRSLFLSTDNGASWKEVIVCPSDSAVNTLTAFNNKVYAGTQKGLYQSGDGTSWTLISAIDPARVTSVVSTEDRILAQLYDDDVFYTSTDGESWNTVKGGIAHPEEIEAYGHTIIERYCRNTHNVIDFKSQCMASKMWVLSKNGKKWEEVEMTPRYFGFDGDNIYAVNVTIEAHKKEFVYEKEIVRSDDRGKSWEKIDEKTDSFVLTDLGMQEKLQELKLWEQEEIQEKVYDRDEGIKAKAQKAKDDLAARKAEMKKSQGIGGYQVYGKTKTNAPPPDYRALQNDVFKSMHNHRDMWIDSKGKIH